MDQQTIIDRSKKNSLCQLISVQATLSSSLNIYNERQRSTDSAEDNNMDYNFRMFRRRKQALSRQHILQNLNYNPTNSSGLNY